MRVRSVGEAALLADVGSATEALDLCAAAWEARLVCDEVVPGARTVLFDGVGADVAAWLAAYRRSPSPAVEPREVRLPTTYGGPDLAETAELLGLRPDVLVERHSSTTFTVAFCGFAPGFAYCTGLGLEVPRLPSPRPRVRAGSVGLAGEYTGVYPTTSPGGWRIIGRTDAVLWDAGRPEPALLAPGTVVRFDAR